MSSTRRRTAPGVQTRTGHTPGISTVPGNEATASLASGQPDNPAESYLVCPVYGNIYAADNCDPYCPHC